MEKWKWKIKRKWKKKQQMKQRKIKKSLYRHGRNGRHVSFFYNFNFLDVYSVEVARKNLNVPLLLVSFFFLLRIYFIPVMWFLAHWTLNAVMDQPFACYDNRSDSFWVVANVFRKLIIQPGKDSLMQLRILKKWQNNGTVVNKWLSLYSRKCLKKIVKICENCKNFVRL